MVGKQLSRNAALLKCFQFSSANPEENETKFAHIRMHKWTTWSPRSANEYSGAAKNMNWGREGGFASLTRPSLLFPFLPCPSFSPSPFTRLAVDMDIHGYIHAWI